MYVAAFKAQLSQRPKYFSSSVSCTTWQINLQTNTTATAKHTPRWRTNEVVRIHLYFSISYLTMSTDSAARPAGGLKGFLKRTGKFVFDSSILIRDKGSSAARWGYRVGGKVAFAVATTSMIVLMPLLFEIAREAQMLETERAQIKDLKGRGYSDRQLQELGFSESALHSPSVASLQK